jgi:hypothetical protein
MTDAQAWLALLGLGAFHGINPGMGWLFAVALGLQEQRRGAVLRALLPIALGHALSIGVVVLAIGLLHDALPEAWVRWPVGLGLAAFGAYKLVRCRHPRWVGMRVSALDLTWWSFLMATAHGAGLMLAPVLLGWGRGPRTASTLIMRSIMPGMRRRSGSTRSTRRRWRGGLDAAARAGGDGDPHPRVPAGHGDRRGGDLREGRPRDPPQGVVQPRRRVGGRAGDHGRRDARAVTARLCTDP